MVRREGQRDDSSQAVADHHGANQLELCAYPSEFVGQAIDHVPLLGDVTETVTAQVTAIVGWLRQR